MPTRSLLRKILYNYIWFFKLILNTVIIYIKDRNLEELETDGFGLIGMFFLFIG